MEKFLDLFKENKNLTFSLRNRILFKYKYLFPESSKDRVLKKLLLEAKIIL